MLSALQKNSGLCGVVGYHVCFTRIRSPVRARAGTSFSPVHIGTHHFFPQSMPLLSALFVCRYSPNPDKRVVLVHHYCNISDKIGNKHMETVKQLLLNDNFILNNNYMIKDEDSSTVIFFNRDDLLLYFAVTDTMFSPDAASKLFVELKHDFSSRINPLHLQELKKNGLQKSSEHILENLAVIFNVPDPEPRLKEYRDAEKEKIANSKNNGTDASNSIDYDPSSSSQTHRSRNVSSFIFYCFVTHLSIPIRFVL